VLALLPAAMTRGQRMVRLGGRLMLGGLVAVLLVSTAFRASTTERTRTQPVNEAQLVLKTLDPRESSDWVLRGRVAWWKAAGGMFADQPLTGVGLGRFPRLLEAYGGGRSRENAHNLVLQLLAEAGVPGAIAFLVFAAALCAAFFGVVRHGVDASVQGLALGGGIAVTAFLLTLVTGHTLLVPSGQILFASFVAAVGCAAGAGRPVVPCAGRRIAIAAACAAVVMAYPVIAWTRTPAPRFGPWGSASGLFAEEPSGGGLSYRWTGADALLDLDVPTGTTTLELPVAVPAPVRRGAPTRVQVSVGEWIHQRVFSTPDVQTIRIRLDRGREDPGGRLLVRIHVEPAFTPAAEDPSSTDTRALGIQLLPPRFTR
jgi:hypothetical protein